MDSKVTRQPIADEFAQTQPILETLLIEIRNNNSNINLRLDSIERHLDQQDLVQSKLSGQINLAGNIAAEAKQAVEDLATEVKAIHEIVKRIDRALLGTTELAKSGFDMVTALRSVREPEPITDSDWPQIDIEEYSGSRYAIVGTGV